MVFKFGAAAIAMFAACSKPGPGTPPPPDDSTATFVAFPATFHDFRSWTSFHSDGPPDDGSVPADVLGPRTQYINKLPPHGSHEFPVGTIIVEVRESGSMQTFAGVKRGGGYNADGATNWEWFELAESGGTVNIVWRGLNPPAGMYGGVLNSCNDCHRSCGGTNDFVCSPKLQLASF